MREAFPESVAVGRLGEYAAVVETGTMLLKDVNYTRGPVAHGLRIAVVKVGDGVHVNAVDLSARIQAAEERERLLATAERAREEAERANRAKSDFLAVVSHELRTPLSAIDGYAELMEMGVRGPLTEQQRHDLERIRRSQRHLLGLINGVLNYARVEAGTVQYNIEPVVVANVLTSCEELTGPQMRAKGLTYRILDCDPALRARADFEKVEQVLINLLTNALKFTDSGGSVTVSCVAGDQDIAIAIEDTGRGIAANKLERVFEPFVQIDSQLTCATEGIGLGLAISRDLAHGMGGNIVVESTPDVGSVFTLTLPQAI